MPNWDPRALAVLDLLERAGHHAVLVGGCVRDFLLGLQPHDYDAATSARPEEMLKLFEGWRVVETGVRHGTLTIFSDGLPVEVTTFRMEGDYTDHRHPDGVSFTRRLEKDLQRRDFTVNAMAWNQRDGLTDLFGGQADLEAKVLRCVGAPKRRFEEDALRMLRCLRFSAQLGFAIHSETAAALDELLPLLDAVSRERVMEEFCKLICAPGAVWVLREYPNVVARVLPELIPAMGFDQHTPYHCYDVYTHSIRVLGNTPPNRRMRLAALLHDVGKPHTFAPDEEGVGHFPDHAKVGAKIADQALRRLRLDNASREQIVTLIARHGMRLPAEERVVKRWLSRLGPELFFDLMALDQADNNAKRPEMVPE
ncbi:MAG: CCA tRNA nucleotidyltransferase, partial [Oscillibacter sp.]|nr:CCA tRNA nucleotidyltransferase [Oscillibacter sp.]